MPRARQPVILPDPEMVLPDEKLPPHDEIEAVSHLFGGKYPSLQAMIRARKKVEFVLGANITEEQKARCVPGSYCYFEVATSKKHKLTDEVEEYLLPVFGEIPDVEDLEKSERAQGGQGMKDDAHARALRRRTIDAHNRGWLFGKWYSTLATEGEWGAIHISMLVPMERESFLAAEARGWKAA